MGDLAVPLISVIMPSYNGERYIVEAIESILEQSYKNLELIIIEDCSTDNSIEIIQRYAVKDQRIKVSINEKNRGIAYSTNKGIELARGKYIALLDDDDISTKDRIKLQVEYLEKNAHIDILGGRTITIDEDGQFINDWGTPRNNPQLIKAKLLFENVDFGNSSVMIRKEFIEKNNLKYRDGSLGMQDFRFFMESSKVGNISSIDEILLKHRVHKSSETNKNKSFLQYEREAIYAKIQRESLERSGFCLEEKEFEVITLILKEKQIDGNCLDDWYKLYTVFKVILEQAKKMQLEFYNELLFICKQKLRVLYNQIDLFYDV